MRNDLIKRLEYIKLCAERAILQERREMEILGKWYMKQQLSDIERSLEKSKSILSEGKQIEVFPKSFKK